MKNRETRFNYLPASPISDGIVIRGDRVYECFEGTCVNAGLSQNGNQLSGNEALSSSTGFLSCTFVVVAKPQTRTILSQPTLNKNGYAHAIPGFKKTHSGCKQSDGKNKPDTYRELKTCEREVSVLTPPM